jgi:hypothetical protein
VDRIIKSIARQQEEEQVSNNDGDARRDSASLHLDSIDDD